MREIKFRAWYKGESYPMDPDNLEEWEKPRMFYGVEKLYDGGVEGLGGVSSFGVLLKDEQYIIEQFTGLRDRNGREIYEGDIVRLCRKFASFQGDRGDVGAVTPDPVELGYVIEGGWRLGRLTEPRSKNIEVIGNIHEHPHLLEGEKK